MMSCATRKVMEKIETSPDSQYVFKCKSNYKLHLWTHKEAKPKCLI